MPSTITSVDSPGRLENSHISVTTFCTSPSTQFCHTAIRHLPAVALHFTCAQVNFLLRNFVILDEAQSLEWKLILCSKAVNVTSCAAGSPSYLLAFNDVCGCNFLHTQLLYVLPSVCPDLVNRSCRP